MSATTLNPQIRFADTDENEPIAHLINAAFVVERFFIDRDRTSPPSIRALMDKGRFMLAADGPQIAACVYLEVRGDRGYVGLLAVDPSLQKSGLGRRMMDAAEEHFQAAGCQAVDLQIVNLRHELPAFYRKLGYVETGTAPFAADAEPSRPCHFIKMSKQLV
jgi:ribosomal protein S18 acetylase RimI-like enzyme